MSLAHRSGERFTLCVNHLAPDTERKEVSIVMKYGWRTANRCERVKDRVDPHPEPLDITAVVEDLGQITIARYLGSAQILDRHPEWQAAWADPLDPVTKLLDSHQ